MNKKTGRMFLTQGRAASSSYNTRIRNGTLLLGVLEALEEKRPGALSDVKRTHFRLMKVRYIFRFPPFLWERFLHVAFWKRVTWDYKMVHSTAPIFP